MIFTVLHHHTQLQTYKKATIKQPLSVEKNNKQIIVTLITSV